VTANKTSRLLGS